jgi:hypothetical protein
VSDVCKEVLKLPVAKPSGFKNIISKTLRATVKIHDKQKKG